ncbi:exported hypothetical protein [Agrobacterium genomosp. 2 str. CFBP 5494]|uniref:Uncharacterized protein n=2 Tax=Agrobacterium tumefaciens complex TaxID=1183400 RepID=A0A9W5B570_9HYPH|nr:exported hypothetical protein [Agrobacterium genomosp. 2 str. CFBP 5494]
MTRLRSLMTSILVASAFVGTSAAEAQTTEQNRYLAAMVEWAVANCEAKEMSALVVSMASMVVNGSAPGEMDNARAVVRKGTMDNYPSKEAACADIVPRLQTSAKPVSK